jgi:hypothetical protein
MLLATLLLVFSNPQIGDTAKAVNPVAVVSSHSADESSSLSEPLPSAPEPKVKTDAESERAEAEASSIAAAAPAEPAIEPGPAIAPAAPMSFAPAKPFVGHPYETPQQRKLWYALTFAGSGAAAFDAWSTRRAITQGYAVEANPLLRPFSHSGALYAATQVSPLVMDYIGKRMMLSQHWMLRRMWWLPQAAGTGVSLAAGVHNVGMVP